MAVRNVDLVDFFGADNVVLADPGVLASLNFPADAIEVLAHVGLPTEVEPLPFTPADPRVLPDSPLGEVYVFGTDLGSDYGVAAGTGEVWELPRPPEQPPVFINSDLASFVECMLRFEILWRQIPEEFMTDHTVGKQWGTFLEEELAKVDARSVASPDAFFAFIVRDIKNGTF